MYSRTVINTIVLAFCISVVRVQLCLAEQQQSNFHTETPDYVTGTQLNQTDDHVDFDGCHHTGSFGDVYTILAIKQHSKYKIYANNKSSIIRLHMIPECNGQSSTIRVTISETDSTGNDTIQQKQSTQYFVYLSESSQLEMEFQYEGAPCNLSLKYQEIQYELHTTILDSDSGEIASKNMNGSFFRPNTATVYQLVPKPQAWNTSSVSVTVKSLLMDDGDYILIGAGNGTFNGPPAAYLHGLITKPKAYQIAAENAYIVFYRGSRCTKFTFKIEWHRTGEQITTPPDDTKDVTVSDSLLQAVPVCFYNASWISEFNRTTEAMDMFAKFQAKFAEVANRYVKEKNIKYVQEIRPESVQLIQVSSILSPNEDIENLENGALYTIIGIVQPYNHKLSVFRWHEMKEILQRFDDLDEENHYMLLGFKVGVCPKNLGYLSWYYATGLVVLVCGILLLTIWLCSFNTSWKTKYRSKRRKLQIKLPRLPNKRKYASNEYVAYDNHGFEPPTLTIQNERMKNLGASNITKKTDKHYTSVFSDDSDEEIFTESWLKRHRSSSSDLPSDSIFDARERRLNQMHMFDVPLHDEVPTIRPRQLWTQDKKIEDTGSSTPKSNTFGKSFDSEDDNVTSDKSNATKL